MAIAALVAVMVVLSILKPWAGTDQAQVDRAPARLVSAADIAPLPTSSSPGSAENPARSTIASAASLAPGQVDCDSSDWSIVTLGSFLRWTVRTWIAIAPVQAGGPADPLIPAVALDESDVAGMGACAPATSGALGRASRIVAAWRRSAGNATTATFERVALSDLDNLHPVGPGGGRGAPSSAAPMNVGELVRPSAAGPRGRWPAGRYVLLLASPDPGLDLWVAVDIAAASR